MLDLKMSSELIVPFHAWDLEAGLTFNLVCYASVHIEQLKSIFKLGLTNLRPNSLSRPFQPPSTAQDIADKCGSTYTCAIFKASRYIAVTNRDIPDSTELCHRRLAT